MIDKIKRIKKTDWYVGFVLILVVVFAAFAIFNQKTYEQVVYGASRNLAAWYAFLFGAIALGAILVIVLVYPFTKKFRFINIVLISFVLIVAIAAFAMNLVGPAVLTA